MSLGKWVASYKLSMHIAEKEKHAKGMSKKHLLYLHVDFQTCILKVLTSLSLSVPAEDRFF